VSKGNQASKCSEKQMVYLMVINA